ncbi:MAG TPA: ATP-binding protein [Rhodanobacteraceae bacterium]|jgi:dedicated sortase system histidine kinase|nr:ATP-binding protein [Rhodanobacteraceae bacterium]
MSLRLKLLLVALSTLALPWAGWQFVQQTEALLRQGQEQALLASATTLAKAFAASGTGWPAGPVLYVHRLASRIAVDGYADDWPDLAAYLQPLGPAQDAGKLRVALGENRDGLYLFAEVRDATRTRMDAQDPRAGSGDHLMLVLAHGPASARYLLASGAPGPFEARVVSADGASTERIAGAWQEDGSGYRVELRIPEAASPDRIGIEAFDADAPQESRVELRPLLRYDEKAASALAALAPDLARVRVVNADGWLVADTGALPREEAPHEESRGWIGRLVYRGLIAPVLAGPSTLRDSAARLDAAEIWQGLSGIAATSWRSGEETGDVVLSAVVPLRAAGEVRGALVLEQENRVLPTLANRALFGLAGATLAALAIAGLILLLFGASLSFRIRRLRNAAERAVQTSGRLSGPMPLAGDGDELGDLARTFGKLLDEIGAYTDYLRTLASKLSHELNTPLAIVKSSLDNLEHQALPAEARAYADRARDGAERLGKIVRAMSEAGRIERAIAAADAEDFDLCALVAGCAESYRALAGSRRLDVRVPPGAMPFHGAPELVAQALDKLFDNARSFAPDGGDIGIVLERAESGALIRFSNSGSALPAAMHERLFDSLVSVREAAARGGETPHLGLGLYVVRLVAELHRGFAEARNLPDGRGVEFILRLFGMPRRRLSEGAPDA